MRPDLQEQLAKQKHAAEEAGKAVDGLAGVGMDANCCAQTAVDPRRELIYRVERRVDELLAQVTALREAQRILEYASYDTIEVLRKLEVGGVR